MLRACGERWRFRCHAVALATLAFLPPIQGWAHDADAHGGLFRTRDAGVTWTPVNPGIFASGALALAVDPRDSNHLLLATDSGVWRSRNGGRDWAIEAPEILTGPAFAAAFDAGGEGALIAGVSTLYREDGDRWRPVPTPAGSSPARALVATSVRGRVYLAGRSGLYRSDNWGRSWVSVRGPLPAEHVNSLMVPPGRPDDLYVVAGGAVWSSSDGGRSWQPRCEGPAGEGVQVVGYDPSNLARLWAVGAGQVWRSDRQGERWRSVGKPVSDTPAIARAVAVLDDVIMVATDRGVFRSPDAGESWAPPDGSLPAHLAAGMLVRDPRSPATLYAGFAIAQYEDLQPRAPPDEPASERPSLASLAGGVALFVVLALCAIMGVRYLARARRQASLDRTVTRSDEAQR